MTRLADLPDAPHHEPSCPVGRKLGQRITGTTSDDHLQLLQWAEQFGEDRLWAVEDCRQLSRRLERDLLTAGERIVRVPPKMMANVRDGARTYGKSDPIDALAVARAALREPDLPAAELDGPSRKIRLLAGQEDLVNERTRAINRLRWFLHELDPPGNRQRGPCGAPRTSQQSSNTSTTNKEPSPGWPAASSSVAAC